MKYRKKPVVIEAVQLKNFGYIDGKLMPHFEEKLTWIDDAIKAKSLRVQIINEVYPALYIKTLEGNMLCSEGDYIIKGVQGELYPCKPDIFEQTYEKVEE